MSDLIITANEAMAFLGFKSKPDDFPVIEAIVLAFDKAVKNHCGRCFNLVTGAIEYLDGDGTSELWLSDYPVANVVINIDSDQDQVFDDDDIDTEDYVVYPEKGLLYYRLYFPIGHRNVRVTHDKGFSDDDMPADLELVCKVEVKNLYDRIQEGSMGLKDYSVAGMRKTFFDATLTPWSKGVLDENYKKMRA